MSEGGRLPRREPLPASAFDVYLHTLDVVGSGGTRPESLDPYVPAVRGLYAAYLLDGEINNGGFSQLFFNGYGEWLDEAIAGLAAAGLEGHRQVMVEAADYGITLLDELQSAQAGASLQSYADWADTSGFRPFDDRWYALPSIDAAFDRYLVEHADEIWEPLPGA